MPPTGFIQSPTEPVTMANLSAYLAFFQAGDTTIHDYYKSWETEDITQNLQPLSDVTN
jgi:hypothetical protein